MQKDKFKNGQWKSDEKQKSYNVIGQYVAYQVFVLLFWFHEQFWPIF